jgi:hypothetical protein
VSFSNPVRQTLFQVAAPGDLTPIYLISVVSLKIVSMEVRPRPKQQPSDCCKSSQP